VTYLYYPHAPLLLKAARRSGGGYSWKGYGRKGVLEQEEVERLTNNLSLLILTDKEGAALLPRMTDITADRVRTNQRLVG
jgi:hypothetical protein